MKTTARIVGLIALAAGLTVSGCGKKKFTTWNYIKDPAVSAQLQSFITQKVAQANSSTNEAVPEYAPFFAAAKSGNWLAVNNAFKDLRNHAGQYQHSGTTDERIRGTKWQGVLEIWGAFDNFGEGNEKYSAIYANDIIGSIPPGSIYFGGTDPGRFLITAMQKSQVNGDPFFTLTQNALADGTYLDYLRSMYGNQIYIPTPEDSQNCFNDYYTDVQERMKNHKLKPGEEATMNPNTGRLQISGHVAVMEINGLLAKVIFDQNTNQQFYVEESFPLDWMYPYLEPHGLIFKLNRQPLTTLSDDTIQQDHDYWTNAIAPMIGNWLDEDTPVNEITNFAEKVFLEHDFSSFHGDPEFVKNKYSQTMFSRERSSIAGLYAWRAKNTTDAEEKERMNDAADFAFRQAWALCPDSPEVAFGYVAFLQTEKRFPDMLVVAETAAKFHSGPATASLDQLVSNLKRYQKGDPSIKFN